VGDNIPLASPENPLTTVECGGLLAFAERQVERAVVGELNGKVDHLAR
jgi:hypothetical protein